MIRHERHHAEQNRLHTPTARIPTGRVLRGSCNQHEDAADDLTWHVEVTEEVVQYLECAAADRVRFIIVFLMARSKSQNINEVQRRRLLALEDIFMLP
jgi:hypothetical protein